jgi:hypothetical protein
VGFAAAALAGLAAVALLAGGAGAAAPKPVTTAPSGALAVPSAVTATTGHTFYTTDSVIYCNANQGWWRAAFDGQGLNNNCNTNYILIRNYPGFSSYNNFFTFDLSAWTNPCAIQSAYLTINSAGGGYANGGSSLSYGLFDVSTDPWTLNNKAVGGGSNATIYNDLGSGTMYGGPYSLSVSTVNTWWNLYLNQAGLNALMAAHQNHQQYFSIGGSLINPPANSYLFNASGAVIGLTVVWSKLCKVYP